MLFSQTNTNMIEYKALTGNSLKSKFQKTFLMPMFNLMTKYSEMISCCKKVSHTKVLFW